MQELVVAYIKECFKINDIVPIDGTNDGGNDLRFYIGNRGLKLPIQITTQEKKLDEKVLEDARKAQENVLKYGFQNKLFFFCSHTISAEKQEELKLKAILDYNISVEIYDGRRLMAQSLESPILTNLIRTILKLEEKQVNLFKNEYTRMYFDLISFSDDATEIKQQLLNSIVVHTLFNHDKMLIVALTEKCNGIMGTSYNQPFMSRVLQGLETEGKVEYTSILKTEVKLSEGETDRINNVKSKFQLQEQLFEKELLEILKVHGVEDKQGKIFELLYQTFEKALTIGIQEITEDEIKLETSDKDYEKLKVELEKLTSDTTNTSILLKDLLTLCEKNDFFSRTSACNALARFTNPELLQQYLNQKERVVFVDAQIGIYGLLNLYKIRGYNNLYYSIVKDLMKYSDRKKNFHIKISNGYIGEICFHLKEALYLIPYERMGLIGSLGTTNNVFINFFLFLKMEDLLEEGINDLGDFLFEMFQLGEDDTTDSKFFTFASNIVRERLQSLGIEVENTFGEDKETAIDSIKAALTVRKRSRAEASIVNDANVLTFLFSKNNSYDEVIFSTWDLAFYGARKTYYEKRKRVDKLWHLFSPSKLLNHLLLLDLKINPGLITKDILAVLDDGFNLKGKTQGIIDIIVKLTDLKTESGIKFINKYKDFKEQYYFDLSQVKVAEGIDSDGLPVEQIVIQLHHHYTFNDKLNIEDLFALINDYDVDYLLDEIENELKKLTKSTRREISPEFFVNVDNLVLKHKNQG